MRMQITLFNGIASVPDAVAICVGPLCYANYVLGCERCGIEPVSIDEWIRQIMAE